MKRSWASAAGAGGWGPGTGGRGPRAERGRAGAGGGTRRGGRGGGCGAGGGAGRPGPGHPLPIHWRGGFGFGSSGGGSGRRSTCGVRPPPWTGTLPLGDPPSTPSAAPSRRSRRDPRPAGSAGGGGGGTMRRPWGALLLGALLCAHGKRRRRAHADRPSGKVFPWVRPLQDSPPEGGTAQAGAWDPSPSLQAAARRLCSGEGTGSSPNSSSPRRGSGGGAPRARVWARLGGRSEALARLSSLLFEELGCFPFQV